MFDQIVNLFLVQKLTDVPWKVDIIVVTFSKHEMNTKNKTLYK